MKIGSEAHKELFCQSFIDSHLTYEPEQLSFPQLDEATLERLRGIPFWREALRTERSAGLMVNAFANTITDPLIRAAVALQAQEEARHGRLLDCFIQHYDIQIEAPPAPEIPSQLDQAFLDFGFGECLDSFFAFGMFGLARQTGDFPESLFLLFDPILNEEARHTVFFINWVTYLQAQQGGPSFLRGIHASWYYGRALLHLAQVFKSAGDGSGEGFTATGTSTFVDNLTPEQVFSMCLQENARRMSAFDDRLLQPRLLPRLAAITLHTLILLPHRRATQPAASASTSQIKSGQSAVQETGL